MISAKLKIAVNGMPTPENSMAAKPTNEPPGAAWMTINVTRHCSRNGMPRQARYFIAGFPGRLMDARGMRAPKLWPGASAIGVYFSGKASKAMASASQPSALAMLLRVSSVNATTE